MINISVTLGAIIEEDMLLEMENERYTDNHKGAMRAVSRNKEGQWPESVVVHAS